MGISSHAKSVLFTLKDGTKVYYLLGDGKNPIMKLVDGKAIVNDDCYEITDIRDFTISATDDPDAISEVRLPETMMRENCFIVRKAEGEVHVFSLSGMEVKASVEKSGDSTSVSLAGLARGTYVIQIGKNSFKVTKR